MTAEAPDPGAVRALLAEVGEDAGELELSPVEGGASRQTFMVAAEGVPRYVLRREPAEGMSFATLELELRAIAAADLAGVTVARTVAAEPAGGRLGPGAGYLMEFVEGMSFATLELELRAIAAADLAGVTVARTVAAEPAAGRLGPSAGYLMEFVEGTSVAPRVLRRDELAIARERLPGQLASALAQIHSVDPQAVDGLAGGGDPALEACELWERALDEIGEPLPGVEAGLRWLRLNRPPPPERAALVHGDFRLGNFIVDEHGLAAVIDWELCHAGDPAEDVGWLTIRSWRFGNDELPVAGLGELEPFLDAYEAAGGTGPDAERLRWWAAMGNVKWAVICARQAHDHLTGARPSAELASLGRRICEPEWDLLQLLSGD